MRLPNFLFIGPDRSGSTWLYQVLRRHPAVFAPRVKELFFFDRYYERGIDWYSKHFRSASARHRVTAEVCHDYLFSSLAAERAAATIPHAKLMVCLREPIDRAMSAFLFMKQQGRTRLDFVQAVRSIPELTDHGLYAQHISNWLAHFPREQIYTPLFDDLQVDPQVFADGVFEFLGLKSLELTRNDRTPALSSSQPRSRAAARTAHLSARALRDARLHRVIQVMKDSRLLRQLLFESLRDKPAIAPDTRHYLREIFAPDLRRLDRLLGTNTVQAWAYGEC